MKSLLAAILLTLLVLLAGCLSMDRRELLIQDVAAARAFVEQTLPPGATRDRMLARLAAVQSVEELIQVRAAVRAAQANGTPASQPSH